ncbi:MAG: SOS response-associated peptidase [Lachnospiraceae bacterium]|nr:SOS response-associated peptidase [Lachnospiraceae bacterium]
MCGRYYIDDTMFREVRSDFPELRFTKTAAGDIFTKTAAGDIFTKTAAGNIFTKTVAGDIRPSGPAPVIRKEGGNLTMDLKMVWGFPAHGSLLINARSETAAELPAFRSGIRSRRCLIPAAGFYERDRERSLVSFTRDGRSVLYLAGLYDLYPEGDRFVILTTAANRSMAPVHDRMPLMIEPDDAEMWLDDFESAAEMMRCEMPEVRAHRNYQQLSFDFH